MKRIINKAAIAKTNYNSAKVGILSYHALQIKETGNYLGHIMKGKSTLKTFPISCTAESKEYQVNLDFGMLPSNSDKKNGMQLRPEGYVILMDSAGGDQLHFVLEKVDKKPRKAIYKDTTKLQAGDIYACTFLRPGSYTISYNGKNTSTLKIAYPDDKISTEEVKEAIRTKVGGKPIKEIKALPMQGVVFEFENSGQLEIKLINEEKDRQLVKKEVKRFKAAKAKKAKAMEPKTYQYRNSKYAGRY